MPSVIDSRQEDKLVHGANNSPEVVERSCGREAKPTLLAWCQAPHRRFTTEGKTWEPGAKPSGTRAVSVMLPARVILSPFETIEEDLFQALYHPNSPQEQDGEPSVWVVGHFRSDAPPRVGEPLLSLLEVLLSLLATVTESSQM